MKKILNLYLKWKNGRKKMLYENPEKVFEKQFSAIKAISAMEGYKMIKDFHFSEWEKAIENIKKSKPWENIEKHKAIIEYSEKLIKFLESRE